MDVDLVLYLHEYIDIVGQGAVPYMAHTLAFDAAAAADRAVELVGTWYVIGATGRWPQVVNLWELRDGWDSWRALCERTNLRREANAELSEWWDEAYRHRTGGFDRLLAAAPGCPTRDELIEAGVVGEVFVHEVSRVHPGAGPEYLAAVRDEWAPVIIEQGHTLVGLYDVLFGDTEVVTVWATDLDSHIGLQRATSRGDERIVSWQRRRREFCTRFREELMVPGAGTILSRL